MHHQLTQRDIWLSRLIDFQDTGIIKAVSGIRRCGKSKLLTLYIQHLKKSGIADENIIYMNFELMEYDDIRDYKTLYAEIKKRSPKSGTVYILLDEIQQVQNWEKAVVSLNAEGNCDICITGSNAELLSSELATLLSGRCVEICMLPLSFKEYLEFCVNTLPIEKNFKNYLEFGGFPAVPSLPQKQETIDEYLKGIFNTVIVKDILSRNDIRDIDLLEKICRYVMKETGNFLSPNKIAGYLNSSGKGCDVKNTTISRYLTALKSAYVIYEARRFDVRGKEILKTQSKYYAADTGLRNILSGHSVSDAGHIYETVVYLEFLRRGFEVYAGRFDDTEIDFVVRKNGETAYYQVSVSLADENVLKRETAPLFAVADNYPKYVITGDSVIAGDYRGIHVVNIIDFLLEKSGGEDK